MRDQAIWIGKFAQDSTHARDENKLCCSQSNGNCRSKRIRIDVEDLARFVGTEWAYYRHIAAVQQKFNWARINRGDVSYKAEIGIFIGGPLDRLNDPCIDS